MARNASSFRLIKDKKVIVIYSNEVPSPAEETLIKFYLGDGYTPKMEEKKPGIKIKEMRKKLEKEAPDVLTAFNEAYGKKDDKKAFFNACKIYSDWEKAKKNKAEAEAEEAPEVEAEAENKE